MSSESFELLGQALDLRLVPRPSAASGMRIWDGPDGSVGLQTTVLGGPGVPAATRWSGLRFKTTTISSAISARRARTTGPGPGGEASALLVLRPAKVVHTAGVDVWMTVGRRITDGRETFGDQGHQGP